MKRLLNKESEWITPKIPFVIETELCFLSKMGLWSKKSCGFSVSPGSLLLLQGLMRPGSKPVVLLLTFSSLGGSSQRSLQLVASSGREGSGFWRLLHKMMCVLAFTGNSLPCVQQVWWAKRQGDQRSTARWLSTRARSAFVLHSLPAWPQAGTEQVPSSPVDRWGKKRQSQSCWVSEGHLFTLVFPGPVAGCCELPLAGC